MHMMRDSLKKVSVILDRYTGGGGVHRPPPPPPNSFATKNNPAGSVIFSPGDKDSINMIVNRAMRDH